MKIVTASPFRPYCERCERDNTSDWIEARQRFECDFCQRDIQNEIDAALEEAMQEAAE